MFTVGSSVSVYTSLIDILGLDDARFSPSDWSFERNPFWTTYLFTLVVFPCLFYLTWYMNPSLSNNRLGLSWVMGFYSATLFTVAGLYEVPHLRTIFNAAVDFVPAETLAILAPTISAVDTFSTSAEVLHLSAAAARDICYPILKTGTLALVATLPSFLRLDPGSPSKYYCFSDLSLHASSSSSSSSSSSNSNWTLNHFYDTTTTLTPQVSSPSIDVSSNIDSIGDHHQHHARLSKDGSLSLRHRVYQGQMQQPHLLFSLENYPDDGRIGPHIIAANFQAFLVVDLILGFLYYRKQLEPFSTVVHHIIYYFIVVHMRAGDMLSVFCICGTPIEASSIFLAFGRMFPQRRTPIVERLYVLCFVSTRLVYVALLWHEIYYNYPDKSVAFLYTITISLHVYWFVLYLQTQRRFRIKQRRQQLQSVLQSLANNAKAEYVSSIVGSGKPGMMMMMMGTMKDELESNEYLKRRRVSKRLESDVPRFDKSENRVSIELSEKEYHQHLFNGRDWFPRGGAQVV